MTGHRGAKHDGLGKEPASRRGQGRCTKLGLSRPLLSLAPQGLGLALRQLSLPAVAWSSTQSFPGVPQDL